MSKKQVTTLVLAVALIVGSLGGLFAYRGRAQQPLPEGETTIPEDLVKKYEQQTGEKQMGDLQREIKALNQRIKDVQPYQEQLFWVMMDRMSVSGKNATQYYVDYEKKAVVKKPTQQPQPTQGGN